MSLGDEELWRLLARQSRDLDAACEAVGRDAAELRRSVLLGYGNMRPLADAGRPGTRFVNSYGLSLRVSTKSHPTGPAGRSTVR